MQFLPHLVLPLVLAAPGVAQCLRATIPNNSGGTSFGIAAHFDGDCAAVRAFQEHSLFERQPAGGWVSTGVFPVIASSEIAFEPGRLIASGGGAGIPGGLHVFEGAGTTWIVVQTLTPSTPFPGSGFGGDFALEGDVLGGGDPTGCDGAYGTLVNDGAIVPLGLDAGAGSSAWYQYWYRDPLGGAGSLGTALSNAVRLDFE